MKVVRDRIFEEPEVDIVTDYHNPKKHTARQLLHYYHVTEEEDPTEENQRNIQILEVEGEREVEGPKLDS